MFKYGIGNLGIALFGGLFGFTYNFYLYNFDNPAYNIGLILGWTFMIFAIWNTLNDPIFGFISDRTKTRWGRRRPYIVFFVPVMVIGILMIFFPWSSGFNYLFIWILISLFVYDTGYTFVGLTYASLLPELTFDLDKRAKTNIFSIFFAGIATVITFIIGFLFITNLSLIQMVAIILTVIATAVIIFSGITVKEKKQFMEVKALSTKDALLHSFKNKSFLTYEIFNFMYTCVYNILTISLIQFGISVLALSSLEGTILLAAFFLLTFVGIFVMRYFNRALGTKKTVLIFSAIFSATITLVFFAQTYIQTLILVIILGFSYSAPSLLNSLLIADIIDEDELKTGRRREGMYFGGNALITKPAISVAAFLAGLINTYFFFNPSFNVQSPKYVQAGYALLGIRLLMGIIPAVLLALGLIFLIFYPLNKKRVEKLKIELDEFHKQPH